MTRTLISISSCDDNGPAAANALLWMYRRSQRVVDLAHLVAAKWPGAEAVGSGDPLEDFCKDNPETDECKVYEA
jgi:hypothetical protein